MTLLDLFRFLVEGIALLDLVLIEDYSAFLAGHCPDQAGPLCLCQAFVASETGPLADVTDVPFSVILGGRSPAGNDVANAIQFVLRGVCAKQNESSAKAPFHRFEADKRPTPDLRRNWVVAPLCGAGATFSGSSKAPSRPSLKGGGKGVVPPERDYEALART